MKKAITFFIGLVLAACTADESIYRDYSCSFTFDTTLHPLPCQLTGILGNNGHFCKVEASLQQGVRHLHTTRNYDGSTEDIRINTERESKTACVLGANNCIIVGTSSYDMRLIAYDGQCSNCLTDYGGTNYPLTWQQNGQQLFCRKCNRTYDVNNGTVASGDAGHELFRYMAAFDGAILRVWN